MKFAAGSGNKVDDHEQLCVRTTNIESHDKRCLLYTSDATDE